MQLVIKIFIYSILTLFLFLYFMPKKEIYYALEKELEKSEIVLNEESIEENIFSLNLKNIVVYAKGIKVANIENIDVSTTLFSSKITIKNASLDETLPINESIKIANIKHSIFSLTSLNIEANGSFGKANGILENRVLRVDFNDSKKVVNLKKQLKKDDKGWYYETSL